MREKLQLLSKIFFSPPNPRVSGGSPFHHGGFLLHHGGPVFHGGPYPSFPPHHFGFIADLQASLHRLLPLSTITPLPQIPKTLSPPFTTKPPPTLPQPSPSASTAWSRRQRSDLPSQLRRSLTGSSILSRFITVPMTAPLRPPPEPPPLKRTNVWIDSFLPDLRFLFTANTSSHTKLQRPSPFISAETQGTTLTPLPDTLGRPSFPKNRPPPEPPPFRPPPKPNWVMPPPSVTIVVYAIVVCPFLDITFIMKHTGCPSLFWISGVSLVAFALVLDPLISRDSRFS